MDWHFCTKSVVNCNNTSLFELIRISFVSNCSCTNDVFSIFVILHKSVDKFCKQTSYYNLLTRDAVVKCSICYGIMSFVGLSVKYKKNKITWRTSYHTSTKIRLLQTTNRKSYTLYRCHYWRHLKLLHRFYRQTVYKTVIYGVNITIAYIH